MKETKVSFKSKGQKVVGVLYIPNKSSSYGIIVIPGLKSTKEDHTDFSRKLCENGFNVLTLDLRGRGESEGVYEDITFTDSISDTKAAINFLDMSVGIFGSSYGGWVAIFAANSDKRVKALALRYPPTDVKLLFGGKMIEEVKRKGLFRYETDVIDIFTKKFVEDALKYDSFETIKKIKIPVIMFHGDKDDIIPIEGTKKLFKNANEPKKLIVFPNEGHRLTEKSEKKTENETIKWFNKWLR